MTAKNKDNAVWYFKIGDDNQLDELVKMMNYLPVDDSELFISDDDERDIYKKTFPRAHIGKAKTTSLDELKKYKYVLLKNSYDKEIFKELSKNKIQGFLIVEDIHSLDFLFRE